jgi:putative hydrolase of the HAD superfamily
MPSNPAFFYFDLGNVLINFSHQTAARQMAEASGCDFDKVWAVVFDGSLQTDLETGKIDSAQFCERFRQATSTRVSDSQLIRAASEIFWLNPAIVPIVGQLAAAGYRLGVLSNTCQAHWDHVWNRFGLVRYFFSVVMLSFQHGVMKPDPAFFHAAIHECGCRPEQIFFVDDRPEHVAAAKSVGIDAVTYVSAVDLGRQLAARGVLIAT